MRHRIVSMVAVLFAIVPHLAHAGDADDVVFLKNGGRLRGTVIEADPAKGVRFRIADGTIRLVPPKELDHVQYASDQPKPETPAAPPAAPPPSAPPPGAPPPPSDLEGVLRVESPVPGNVSIDGADYGPAPADIPRLTAGRHVVSLKLEPGAGIVERRVTVRPGVTTPVVLEPSSGQLAFLGRKGIHFGAGAEGLYWVDTGYSALSSPGVRAFGRVSYAVSKALDLRVDAAIGILPNALPDDHDYNAGADITDRSLLIIPLTVRADAQLNLGSVYAMSVGVDLGLADIVTNETRVVYNGGQRSTSDAGASNVYKLFGFHGSLLTFRFGPNRELQVAAQEGVEILGSKPGPFFEQTISVSYLFGLGRAPSPPTTANVSR